MIKEIVYQKRLMENRREYKTEVRKSQNYRPKNDEEPVNFFKSRDYEGLKQKWL